MTTLKSSVRIAGQVISNNDPQMVITLDPHAGVQISSIQDDSITYEFKGGVTQEALYNLNLTFTYQGRYQVKVPCTFKHTVVEVDYEVRPVETIVKVWDNGNSLPFQVWIGGEDITSQLTEVKRGIDPLGKILDYSAAPDTPDELKANWWITESSASAEQDITVPYTFKLPVSVDPAQQVRSTNGIFKVSAYDGTEIRTEYKDDVPFLVETNTNKNINIDVWYKGYFAPAKAVSFLAASSDVRPFTVGGTGGSDPKRFQIGLNAGNNPGTSTLKIVLGTSLTNQVEGKNISTVNVESKIYRKGLVVLESPAPITGETGSNQETTVKVEYDGLFIDANDLIWGNTAGDLRFASAAGDKVTWTIMKQNNGSASLPVDTAISVKKGTESPQTYVQKINVLPKPLTVEYITKDSDLGSVQNNLIRIKVTDASGALVTGLTAKTLTVASNPNNPGVSPGYSKVLVAGPSAGLYDISVDLGHLPGKITINLTLEKGGIETVVPAKVYNTVGTSMMTKAVPDTVTSGEDDTVEITFRQMRGIEPVLTNVDVTIVSQEAKEGITIVTPFAPKAGSPGTFVGVVRGLTAETTPQIWFNLSEDYGTFTHQWTNVIAGIKVEAPLAKPIDVHVSTDPLTGVYNETANLGVVLTQSGTSLPLTTPGLMFSFEPAGYLELVTVQPTALVVKLVHEPSVEALPSQMKLVVSDGTDHGEGFFNLITQTNKVKPTMNVVRRVTAKRFEKGNLPIMVTSGDMDYFYTATNWVTKTPGEYVAIDESGKWTCFSAPTLPATDSIQVGFTITQNGIAWAYLATVNFDIEPSANNDVFVVDNQPTHIVGAVGEETTYTVYPRLLGELEPGEVDVSFSGPGASNVTLLSSGISPGNGLTFTFRGVSTVDAGDITILYKVKGTPGTTEGTDLVTGSTDKVSINAAGKLSILKSTIAGNTLTGPVGAVNTLTFEMYLGGERISLGDSRVRISVGGVGVRLGLVSGEDIGYYLNGEEGRYMPTMVAELKDDTSNRDSVPMDVTITAGTPELEAMWWPEYAQDLSPNSQVTVRGVISGGAGGSITAHNTTNVTLDKDPSNGYAVLEMVGGFSNSGSSLYTTANFITGHTGDSFILNGKLTDTRNNKVYDLTSRPIGVKQAVWALTPANTIDASQDGKVTVIDFSIIQARYGDPNHYLETGTFQRVRTSGACRNVGNVTKKDVYTYSVPITSNGEAGIVTVTGFIVEEGITYPFTFDVQAKKPGNTFSLVSSDNKVTVRTGKESTLKAAFNFNGVSLPTTTEGIKAYVSNSNFAVVGFDATGLKVKSTRVLEEEWDDYDVTIKVTYKGEEVSLTVHVTEYLDGKTKPTLTLNQDTYNVRLNDTGSFDLTVMADGQDITDHVVRIGTIQSTYLEIGEDGKWKIIKEEPNLTTQVFPLTISVQYNRVKWVYSVQATFNIGEDKPTAKLADQSTVLQMDLWETKPIAFKVMLDTTDITSSVTEVVNTNKPNIEDMFEFVTISEGVYGFKSIKSDPEATLQTNAIVTVTVVHEGETYNLPMTILLKTNKNPGTIETQRFKVEAV